MFTKNVAKKTKLGTLNIKTNQYNVDKLNLEKN